ncbi:MAG: bifunctional folylpolyglutamate synthase/dihydrofolate synthase [Christensenellales bacterium]
MNNLTTMQYIGSLPHNSEGALQRTRQLLNLLGNPQEKYRCLHVAGTNGKGSVCAFLHAALTACGFKTGLYTSPFLERFEERMQINKEISAQELAETATLVRIAAEKAQIAVGFFDFVTCVAFQWFANKGCAYAVIETGLGGRLDPTNVIVPAASLITAIGKDHTGLLGNTISEIALEKCGIIKENIPVFIQHQEQEALKVIQSVCKEKNCRLISTDGLVIRHEKKERGQKITITADKDVFSFDIALEGKFQIENAVQAFLCMQYMSLENKNMPLASVYDGLSRAYWPGRMEFITYKGYSLILDGAHNPQGAAALKEAIAELNLQKKVVLLCGVMADKDIPSIVEQFEQFASHAVCTLAEQGRGLSPGTLASYFKKCSAQYENDWESALDIALKKSGGGILVVAGSIYLCGKVRRRIMQGT